MWLSFTILLTRSVEEDMARRSPSRIISNCCGGLQKKEKRGSWLPTKAVCCGESEPPVVVRPVSRGAGGVYVRAPE